MPALRGQVVVLDFWDYTCVSCVRSLPYVQTWWQRYRDMGLCVVGIHTPQFMFGRERKYVLDAVHALQLQYPILLDPERLTWTAWANRFWPSRYVVNVEGYLRYFHYGEGEYLLMESTIQALLRAVNPHAAFPPPLLPMYPNDEPGAVCYPATSELYLGYQRGYLGNREGIIANQVISYVDRGEHLPDTVYLAGNWRNDAEAMTLMSDEGIISVLYRGKDVKVVMQAAEGSEGVVEIEQDGAPPSEAAKGGDLSPEGKAMVARVTTPRLYTVIENQHFGSHALRLRVKTPGVSVYALTFVTECVVSNGLEEAS